MNATDQKYCHYESHVIKLLTQIEAGVLERGGLFGFRSALAFTLESKDNMELVSNKLEPARLTVLVETSKVVLYFFSMTNYKYLPEEIKVG